MTVILEEIPARDRPCRRHRWRVKSREEQAAPFDQLARLGLTQLDKAHPWVFEKPVIVTYRCPDCGTEEVRRV